MMEVSESERIIFGDPFLADIDREGICGVDMHCHTNHSDAPVKISDLLRYAEKKKIGIAITDHNQVSGSIQAIKNSRTTLVIPGIEVSALDGPHILLYFYQPGIFRSSIRLQLRGRNKRVHIWLSGLLPRISWIRHPIIPVSVVLRTLMDIYCSIKGSVDVLNGTICRRL